MGGVGPTALRVNLYLIATLVATKAQPSPGIELKPIVGNQAAPVLDLEAEPALSAAFFGRREIEPSWV